MIGVLIIVLIIGYYIVEDFSERKHEIEMAKLGYTQNNSGKWVKDA